MFLGIANDIEYAAALCDTHARCRDQAFRRVQNPKGALWSRTPRHSEVPQFRPTPHRVALLLCRDESRNRFPGRLYVRCLSRGRNASSSPECRSCEASWALIRSLASASSSPRRSTVQLDRPIRGFEISSISRHPHDPTGVAFGQPQDPWPKEYDRMDLSPNTLHARRSQIERTIRPVPGKGDSDPPDSHES